MKLQELLTRGAEDELIQSEIMATVVNAVKTQFISNNFLAMRISPASIPGDQINIPRATKNSMIVHQVAEGQEIPVETEGYDVLTLTPKKYGVRPLITTEMTEDLKFDVIQRQIAEAGYQMGRKLDQLIIQQMETDAGATTAGGATINISNIAESIFDLESNDHVASDFVVGNTVASDLRNIDTFVEADKAGIANPGVPLIGTIFGMKVWQTNNISNSLYALVIDKMYAAVLAEKRPVTIERYDDVTRDMRGIAVTARWAPGTLRANAISKITTS